MEEGSVFLGPGGNDIGGIRVFAAALNRLGRRMPGRRFAPRLFVAVEWLGRIFTEASEMDFTVIS